MEVGGGGRVQTILGFICAGVNNVGGYERNAWYNLMSLTNIPPFVHQRRKTVR